MASLFPENPLDEIKNEFDLDSVDGFKSFLQKAFSKYVCVSGEQVDEKKGKLEDSTDSKKKDGKDAVPVFKWDDTTYNFLHSKRGLAIIINNEVFSEYKGKKLSNRPESSCDASALNRSFRSLGFNVMPFENLSAWKMIQVLKAAALSEYHKDSDCFACAILTHGDQILTQKEWDRIGTDVRLDLLFGSDGKAIATKAVVEIFNDMNCPNLIGKPRMFFLQACRGDKYDHGQTVFVTKPEKTFSLHGGRGDQRDAADSKQDEGSKTPTVKCQESLSSSVDPPQYHISDATDASGDGDNDECTGSDENELKEQENRITSEKAPKTSDKAAGSSSSVKDIPVSPAPLYKDCLIMYATPPGHFAWRRSSGSWFVQTLCRIIKTNVLQSTSLLRVLTQVCGETARKYQSYSIKKPEMSGKKEVPVIESMLVKDVVFTPK